MPFNPADRRAHVLNNGEIYMEFVRESRQQTPYTPLVEWIAANAERVDADIERAQALESGNLQAQPDPEYKPRIDAERVTWELRTKSTRRLDAGRQSIEDSPLFGGQRQQGLF